jgi:hypothetical protein
MPRSEASPIPQRPGARRSTAWVGLALVLAACAGAPEPGPARPSPTRACVPDFPDRDGWYGGDGAFSIPLPDAPDAASLWLFGDSFVERPEAPGRRAPPFVPNTIGRSHCSPKDGFAIEYHWRSEADGQPSAFFSPNADAPWAVAARTETGGEPWYWPFGGLVLEGRLHVGLLRVVPTKARGPFRLPFDVVGVDLARIADPEAPPSAWRIEIVPLSDDETLLPTGAFVSADGFVTAFAFFDRAEGSEGVALIRWPLASFAGKGDDLRSEREVWTSEGVWRRGDAQDAAIVMADRATELSVVFDDEVKRWVAVTLPPGPVPPGGSVFLQRRHAEALTGPWSPAVEIAVAPPPKPAPGPGAVFCYAGKAHPQFSRAETLLATFVCSLYSPSPRDDLAVLRQLVDSRNLYRPTAVEIPGVSSSSSGGEEASIGSASGSGAGWSTRAIGVGASAGLASSSSTSAAVSSTGASTDSGSGSDGDSGAAVLRPR